MRLRNVQYAEEKIASNEAYITSVSREETKNLNQIFDNNRSLNVEIGTGKGQFIHTLASFNKEENFMGIELYDSVIVRALEKQLANPKDNLHLVKMDASQIDQCFAPGSISTIYLNFSDPWPKKRHAKRRLTHENFLKKYETLLKKDGTLNLKTDNRKFFEYSLESFNRYGVRIEDISLNVHEDESVDNIETEFEEKFKTKGPIYKLKISF